MQKIVFYQSDNRLLNNVLPALIRDRLNAGGARQAIIAEDSQQMHVLDKNLWSFDPASFIPHSIESDPRAFSQPVLLALSALELEQRPEIWFINQSSFEYSEETERVNLVFNGSAPETLSYARAKWKELKASDADLTYLDHADNL